jgi:hypothetical protein
MVGTTTSVREVAGTPWRRSSRGSRHGRTGIASSRCTSAVARSLAGTSANSEAQSCSAGEPPAARASSALANTGTAVNTPSSPR